jgi:FkbM family methyltransferase
MSTNPNPLHALSDKAWNRALQIAHPRIAIDAGANEGGYTHLMLESGLSLVHAFEPVPSVFDKLLARYLEEPRVFCNRMGLSDYKGSLKDVTVLVAWTIGKPNEYGLSVSPGWNDKPKFNVELTTIDSYLGGSPCGFMKIDVDGYEHKVLSGASHTLSTWKPPMLIEFSCYIPAVSGSVKDFLDFIFFYGYVVMSMDGRFVAANRQQVEPHYPYTTSFDVMLIHRDQLQNYVNL